MDCTIQSQHQTRSTVMLLCNIHVDPAHGHCNGTCYIVHHIRRRYITAHIGCGEYSVSVLLLPHIPLSPTDAGVVPLDKLCLTDINSPSSKFHHNPACSLLGCYMLFSKRTLLQGKLFTSVVAVTLSNLHFCFFLYAAWISMCR